MYQPPIKKKTVGPPKMTAKPQASITPPVKKSKMIQVPGRGSGWKQVPDYNQPIALKKRPVMMRAPGYGRR